VIGMNAMQQFDMLAMKSLAVQEGIDLLRQEQANLIRARSAANAWGTVSVMANLTLIPLNVIVNAFQLKAANSLYQHLVRQLYGKVASSSTRIDGSSKLALSLVKQAVTEELRRKALTAYVPGVNILVGLAEDSLAAWQAVQVTTAGSAETAAMLARLERTIAVANQQLVQIGIRLAGELERGQLRTRTA
jgi:hypothetical protein